MARVEIETDGEVIDAAPAVTQSLQVGRPAVSTGDQHSRGYETCITHGELGRRRRKQEAARGGPPQRWGGSHEGLS